MKHQIAYFSAFFFLQVLFTVTEGILNLVEHPSSRLLSSIDGCNIAYDVLFLLDVTGSQTPFLPSIKRSLYKLTEEVKATQPTTRFGLATFRDKNINDLGSQDPRYVIDHCLHKESGFDDTAEQLESRILSLEAFGGIDWPESQLDSLYRVALSPLFKWRDPLDDPSGLEILRAVVVITDSIPHRPDDLLDVVKRYEGNPPYYSAEDARSFIEDSADGNIMCNQTEYPANQLLGQVLKERSILPVFLFSPGAYLDNTGRLVAFPEMNDLAVLRNDTRYSDPYEGIALVYSEVVHEMNITGIVQSVDLGFENFEEAFRTMAHVIGMECKNTTTTTMSPTTSTPKSDVCPTGCCREKVEIRIEVEKCC